MEENSEFGAFYAQFTTLEACRRLAEMRRDKDNAEAELTALNKEIDFVSKVLLPGKFQDEGIKNLSIDDVGRISLRADIYASVKSGKQVEARQWLSDVGSGDLIQPTVNPSTLKAFLKARIKAGEEYPEDIFNVTPYQQATITKG